MSALPRRTEHPYRAKTLEELPGGLFALAEQTLPADDPVEKIFIFPGQMLSKKMDGVGGQHWVSEQALLFTQRGVVHVKAGKSAGEPGQAAYLTGSSLLYAKISLILLYGKMEICSAVDDQASSIVVEYNAVAHDMLEPALHGLIRLAWDQAQGGETQETKNRLLATLEGQSYKFRNGLDLHALQQDEGLQDSVFQPRVFKRYVRLIRRLIAPASLMAITDRQLILIEEGMSSATSYGYQFTYTARANVAGVDARAKASLDEVCVHFKKGAVTSEHRLRMEFANALACQNLWASQAG
jgi:hypothetical protein